MNKQQISQRAKNGQELEKEFEEGENQNEKTKVDR